MKTTASASRVVTEEEMVDWGRQFGSGLENGRVIIALRGELGAGKTTLAQAICAGYGVTADVTSPTFALVHEYASSKAPVYHLDLYRLDGPRDLQNIGFDEIVSSVSLVIVEWPERAERAIPATALALELEMIAGDPARRRLTIVAPGKPG